MSHQVLLSYAGSSVQCVHCAASVGASIWVHAAPFDNNYQFSFTGDLRLIFNFEFDFTTPVNSGPLVTNVVPAGCIPYVNCWGVDFLGVGSVNVGLQTALDVVGQLTIAVPKTIGVTYSNSYHASFSAWCISGSCSYQPLAISQSGASSGLTTDMTSLTQPVAAMLGLKPRLILGIWVRYPHRCSRGTQKIRRPARLASI